MQGIFIFSMLGTFNTFLTVLTFITYEMLHPDTDIPIIIHNADAETTTFVNHIKKLLNMRIRDPTLDVQQLARLAKISPTQLNRKLTTLTGFSTARLITYFRMHYARRLIVETDDDIHHISSTIGYVSPTSFIRNFHQHFHCTPSQYRKNNQHINNEELFTWTIPFEATDYYALLSITHVHTWLAALLIAAITHLDRDDMTVDELASFIFHTPPTLNRKLKRLIAITPLKLFRDLQLQYACELLNSKSVSMTDIAYSTGFFDQAHFCRCFKKSIGYAPSGFKRLANPHTLEWLKKN